MVTTLTDGTEGKSMAQHASSTKAPRNDGTGIVELDPWLEPYSQKLRDRFNHYKSMLAKIDAVGGLLGPISQGHHYFGLNRGESEGKKGVWYREWAPGLIISASSGTSMAGTNRPTR